jgi:hypothetical protein
MIPTLFIYEMGYSCSPGGVDQFEIHKDGEVIKSFDTLADAVSYCYIQGEHFTVFTLEAYDRENA